MTFKMTVTGSPNDGYTAVEIESGDEIIARVFELEGAWYIEIYEPENLLDTEIVKTVLAAKDRLLNYVNRTGEGMPDGLTAAAASLWLLERADGTSSGSSSGTNTE